VGKSTFLNYVLGSKLAITNSKPQTTRDRILGIWNDNETQIIFLDTPGIHPSDKAFNKYMVNKAVSTLSDADLILLMTDPYDRLGDLALIGDILEKMKGKTFLVLNKKDLIHHGVLEDTLAEQAQIFSFIEHIAISALTGEGVDILLALIKRQLPYGPRYFPEDMITDLSLRFLCQELIREKVFSLTHKEIPYSVAVLVEEFKEGDPIYISAVIHVEKASQKAIIIGKGGKMLKDIGTQARIDIQKLLGSRVFLELFVRVTRNWTKNPNMMKDLGYK